MHWIKHLTAFSRKSFMIEVGHELGNGACYAVWLLLERIGEPWDGTNSPELCLPVREWRNIAQLSDKKFSKLLEILQEYSVIFCSTGGHKMTIRADILLELQDESTRKRRKASGMEAEQGRKNSVPDTDKKPEADKRQKTARTLSLQEQQSITNVLRRKGIAPESPLGEGWIAYLEKHSPRNPAGYLSHILTNNPNFDPRCEQPAEPQRQEGCLHISDVLRTMHFPIQQGAP